MVNYYKQQKKLTGWRFAAAIGLFVGAIGAYSYPIIIAPMNNPDKWRKLSYEGRQNAGIQQAEIQPGNMKVWSDPFDRPGKPGNN